MYALYEKLLLYAYGAIILAIPFISGQVFGAAKPSFNFQSTAQAQDRRQLGDLQTDQDVLTYYRSVLVPQLELLDTIPLLREGRKSRRTNRSVPPPSLRAPALDFTKSIIIWQQADTLQKIEEHQNDNDVTGWFGTIQAKHEWQLHDMPPSLFKETHGLLNTLEVFSVRPSPSSQASEEYHTFAAFLDRQYPNFVGNENSWLQIAVQGQTAEMERRFGSYWEEFPNSRLDKNSSVSRYYKHRLEGILYSQVMRLSQEMKIKAETLGRMAWRKLSTWKEAWSHERGLLRLCGTWKWVIHNHQNHADHKMTLIFPHPHENNASDTLPGKIVTIGDLVYFRWEFKGGIQEDSLLFSKKDMRLEGSFRNSTGPHGNVSGNKIGPCRFPRHVDK